jgi:hypothetical protein
MLQVEEVRATLPLVESGSLKDIFSNAGKEKNFHRACLGTSPSPVRKEAHNSDSSARDCTQASSTR